MAEINELIKLYPEKESQILRMYAKNRLLVNDKSGIIINDECLEILGEDKVNLISCFPEIARQVVKLDTKTLKLIERLTEQYQKSNDISDWTLLFNDVLKNISEYKALIDSIEVEQINLLDPQELNNLINIMIDENSYDISSVDHVKDYRRIRSERCKAIFESTTDFDLKLDMVLTSKFGISKKYAEGILERYGEDIESIKDENLKSFVKSLGSIYNISENEDNLKKLNLIMSKDAVVPISVSEGFNRLSLEQNLKRSYMELYIDAGLFSISDGMKTESKISDMTNAENIYELPIDENGIKNFNMLITCIGACTSGQKGIEDYYKSWNRGEIKSPHICCSYIRRDYLNIAGAGVCYGFNNIKADDIVLSGAKDISSNEEGLGSNSNGEDRYYNPDNQIKNTDQYNEMDIRRTIQVDGENMTLQPDYIIVFKSHGEVAYMREAQKASEDFKNHTGKNLPILIIDKDKCRETEMIQIAKMQLEYENNPTIELKNKINDKKTLLLKNNGSINIEDSITAYQITLMQMELEKNPTNIELRDKIEILKKDYTTKLIAEGRIASGTTIEENIDLGTDEEIEEWSEPAIDNGNEWDDEELDSWDNLDSWDDEIVDEDEIVESFNQLISKKYSTLKGFAENGKTAEVSETFLTDEKAKQIARSEGVPYKKEFVQEDFLDLESTQEISKEVKSFD